MNILVVGSQGFIGSHLVDFLLESGHTVIGCDLVESYSSNFRYFKVSVFSVEFEQIFQKYRIDLCINAAGSGNVPYSLQQPLSDYEANTHSVFVILNTIWRLQPSCKFIQISSAAVYGNPAKLPIGEQDSLAPISPYGYHKLISENICKEYFHLFSIPIVIIRPFSVYGPRLRKQLFWDIYKKCSEGETLSLFGTGRETRDFIHVRDLCELILIVANKARFSCDIFNAATGKETTIAEVAALFVNQFPNIKSVLFSGEEKLGDPKNWRADVSRIEAIGFIPQVDIQTGINDYINSI